MAMYYIGIPLLLFYGLFKLIPSKFSRITAVIVMCFAVANISVFTLKKNQQKKDFYIYTREAQEIYNKLPKGSKIYFAGNKYSWRLGHHAQNFYYSGHYFTATPDMADFIISLDPRADCTQLTNNRYFNLYKPVGSPSRSP